MPDGPDGGVDVVGSGVVAQVKWWSAPVGISEVQRLRGTAHSTYVAAFYSRSGYTRSAIAWADTAAVALFAFDETGTVSAVNTTGETVAPPPALQDGESIDRARAAWQELDLALKRHRRARDVLLRGEVDRILASGQTNVPDALQTMLQNGQILEESLKQTFAWHNERNLIWREKTILDVLRTLSEMESVWEWYWQLPRSQLLPPLERFRLDEMTGIWRDLQEEPASPGT